MKPSTRIVLVVIVAVALATCRRAEHAPQGPKPRGTIFVFANISRLDERDDAGATIVRTVNAARGHGPQVIEYNSGIAPKLRKQYHVVVEPTVIFLDENGREIARHEGDDPATVAAVRADVDRVIHGHS